MMARSNLDAFVFEWEKLLQSHLGKLAPMTKGDVLIRHEITLKLMGGDEIFIGFEISVYL